MTRLVAIVEKEDYGPREVTSASRVLMTASKINLEQVSVVIKAEMHEKIEPRLRELERVVKERGLGRNGPGTAFPYNSREA
jgi:hypothetical protein